MSERKVYRHCPEHHNNPCYNSVCEHQCFHQEEQCRAPEHHHEKPQSEKTWEEMMQKLKSDPYRYHNSTTPQPITIHVHNDFGPLLESFLSIHQKLDKIMSNQTDIAQGLTALTAQVAKIGEESKATLQKVADLEAAINNAPVTPELQAAFDALKAQVILVDDLIPDAPAPTA